MDAKMMLSDHGFQIAFQRIKDLILQTHSDPLLECFKDEAYMGSDPYFHLQMLHLAAEPQYLPQLEEVMAAHAARFVSKPRHLLAMDTSVDYRGHTSTPREFNEDAYEVSKLFHWKQVPFELFAKFVGAPAGSTRESEYERLRRRKVYAEVRARLSQIAPQSKKRSRAAAAEAKKLPGDIVAVLEAVEEPEDDAADAVISLLNNTHDSKIARYFNSVVWAVAVAQKCKVLATALRRFEQVYRNRSKELEVLRAWLVGPDMDDGGARPDETLRAISRWG